MADKLNVGFLRGSQSKLDSLQSYVAGSFYLTTDSNRLYFAQSSSELEYLNKYITTVATVADLYKTSPHEGDFYYVSDGNILCFYNGGTVTTSAGWTQVNVQTVDTNLDTKVTGATLSNTVDADSIDVAISIAQTTTNHANGGSTSSVAAVTGSTSIKKSDLDAWYNKSNVGVSASAPAANVTTVSTTGTGNSTQNFKVTGGDNVTISGSKDAIVISAKDTINTADLSSSGTASTAVITLTTSDNQAGASETDNITLKGNTDVIVSGSTAGTINITHKTGYLTNSNANVSGKNLKQGDTIQVIGAVKTSNGHVTAVETTDYVLPEIVDAAVDADGKINIVVEDAAGSKETIVGTNAIGYKVGGTLVPLNQDLNDYYYTETEIDNKFADHLKSVNAMTYKGSWAQTTLPSSAAIGDTYIIGDKAAGLTVGSEVAKVGDLIIAYGTEGADGNISGAITWELIPGTEVDTTYTLSAAGDKVTLTPSNGNAQNLTLADDDVVTLTSANNTITAGHVKVNPTNTAASTATTLTEGSTITLVEKETVNAYGHTTAVTNKKYTLPANFNTLGVNVDTKATQLKNSSGSVIGDFVIDGGTRIGVDVVAGDGANDGGVYTIKHAENAPTVTNNTTASALGYGNEFTVVTGVTASSDKTGHLASITTQKFQLPAEVTYDLSGSVSAASNTATITSELKNNSGVSKGTSTAKFTSSTLEVTAANNVVSMELKWGEF